jgi:hypothetical protein
MRKLTLAVEDLAVESFATSNGARARGTVRAHATELGDSCDPAPSCGPETCGAAYCIRHTDNVNVCGGGTGIGCSGIGCSPPSGLLSCAGCTTYDYTADLNADTCGFCMSRESDAPQRCRCV